MMADKEAVKALYRGSEFDYWAARDYIHSLESWFIEKFLDKEKSVLEAGTGGGFLLRWMHENGFQNLRGFDLLPEFVDYARAQNAGSKIQFDCADATALPYEDNEFDQVLYFSHLLSLLPDKSSLDKTIAESWRVLKPGGIALFNVLSYEFRMQNQMIRWFLRWISIMRKIAGRKVSIQFQPMLKRNNRLNMSSIWDKEPYFYWFRAREIIHYLQKSGYEVLDAAYRGADKQPKILDIHAPVIDKSGGHLYLACRKPAN